MGGRDVGLGKARLERGDRAENQLVGLLLVGERIGRPVVHAALVVEEHRERAHLLLAVAAAQVVDIVPARFVERVLDERDAEQELHLRIGHALLKLQRHLARDEVPLVNVGAVRLQNVGHVGGGSVHHVRYGGAPAQADDACGCRRKNENMSFEHKPNRIEISVRGLLASSPTAYDKDSIEQRQDG